MLELDDIRGDFLKKRPATWGELPDLDLYMDQVVSYLGRTQLAPEGAQKLTAAMVNNYVKEGLLPRAKGKRYERPHVALLQLFVALKEVVTVKDAGLLLKLYVGTESVETCYEKLIERLGEALDQTVAVLPDADGHDELVDAAIGYALTSYATKMASQRVLEIIKEREAAKTAALEEKAKREKS